MKTLLHLGDDCSIAVDLIVGIEPSDLAFMQTCVRTEDGHEYYTKLSIQDVRAAIEELLTRRQRALPDIIMLTPPVVE